MLDGADVGGLTHRLGLDGLPGGGDADHVPGQIVDLLLLSLEHQLEDVADVLLVDGLSPCAQGEKGLDGLLRIHDLLRFPGNAQFFLSDDDLHVQFPFDQADIFVKGAE